jgi:hypothetical protein
MSVSQHRTAELELLAGLVRSLEDQTVLYRHIYSLAARTDKKNCRFVHTNWREWVIPVWNILHLIQERTPLNKPQERIWKEFLAFIDGKRFRKEQYRGFAHGTMFVRQHFVVFRERHLIILNKRD